jgi:hypothetical protein
MLGRNMQIIPNVLQNMAEYVKFVANCTDLIRKTEKEMYKLQTRISQAKQCAMTPLLRISKA